MFTKLTIINCCILLVLFRPTICLKIAALFPFPTSSCGAELKTQLYYANSVEHEKVFDKIEGLGKILSVLEKSHLLAILTDFRGFQLANLNYRIILRKLRLACMWQENGWNPYEVTCAQGVTWIGIESLQKRVLKKLGNLGGNIWFQIPIFICS